MALCESAGSCRAVGATRRRVCSARRTSRPLPPPRASENHGAARFLDGESAVAATPPPTRLCRRGLEKAQTASAARNGKSFRAPTVSRLDRHGSAPTLALTVRACPPCWPDPRRTGTAPCPTPATLACVYRCLRACVLARARARGAAGTKRITGRRASGRPAWPWPVGAPTRARSSATRRQGPGQRVFSHPNGSSASTFPTHTHAPPPLRTHIAPTSSTPCCPSKGHTCTLALARARRAKVTAAPHVLLPSGPTSSGDPPPPLPPEARHGCADCKLAIAGPAPMDGRPRRRRDT